MKRVGAFILLLLGIGAGFLKLPPVPLALPSVPAVTNLCVVVWAQSAQGVFSDPTNVCILTNASMNTGTAWWDPVPGVTNYVLGWSRFPITNVYPGTNILWTNTGLATTQMFSVVPVIPMYGLLFIQASSNLVDFYDLSPTPFVRFTNGAGGPVPWQYFRSRTENNTTNWR